MPEENENLDSGNEEKNEEEETSEKTSEESQDDSAQKIKELEDKNKQLYERAKKAENKAKEIKEEPKVEETPPPRGLDYETGLKLEAEGLNSKQILTLKEEADKLEIPVNKLADNKTFMAGFKAEVKKDEDQEATPEPSDTVAFNSEIKKAKTPEERQQAFEKIRKATVQKRK